jgi:hypothetical protein
MYYSMNLNVIFLYISSPELPFTIINIIILIEKEFSKLNKVFFVKTNNNFHLIFLF